MFANDVDVSAVMPEHLSGEIAQPSITKDRYPPPSNRDLFDNAAGGGDGFHKHGSGCGERVRNRMQIVFGDQHRLCESTIMIQDSHNGAFGAMRRQATATNTADSAGTIDLADNSLADISAGPRDAHEFVSEYSPKTHVATTQLQIRLANASFQNIDGDFVRPSLAELS